MSGKSQNFLATLFGSNPFHPFAQELFFDFPLLVFKGIDFTTGHSFSFFPGGDFSKWKGLLGGRRVPSSFGGYFGIFVGD